MGFWSIFTGAKATAKTVEHAAQIGETLTTGIVSGIDALILTDEEKIQYNQKGTEIRLKFWETFGKENTQQSLARRELAKMSFQIWFFLILAGVVSYIISALLKSPAGTECATFIFSIIKEITWLIGMIAATYFVPHQVSKIWTSKNTKD